MKYKKICQTCGREYVSDVRNQRFCCIDCRPRTHKKYARYKKHKPKTSNLNDVAKEAHKQGLTYGQYVAQQYISERMNKNNA